MKKSIIAALILLTFVAASQSDLFFQIKKSMTLYGAVYKEVALGYVDEIPPERLMRTGMDAMLQSLDPYTVFYDDAANEDGQIQGRGATGSVGMGVGIREGQLTVLELLDGYAALEQGIRIGDQVIQIETQNAANLSVREAMSLLNGEPNAKVLVKIRRGAEMLDFTLHRKRLLLKSVSYSGFFQDDSTKGIGYVKLTQFGRGCAGEIQDALKTLQQTGKLKSVVLDFRGNPGGLLDEAVNIVSLFVPKGTIIVSTRGRESGTEVQMKSNTVPMLPDMPLAILIDEGSASASEVVSGAIQDLDRGIIIGQSSFGKGLVQNVKPLPYNTSMKFTIAKYYTPSGRCIQALNYSEKDEFGHAKQAPDSLRRNFKTAKGRTVKDGRGIDPDILLNDDSGSELEASLLQKGLFFGFANKFAEGNPQIQPNFEVNDRLYGDFQGFVRNQQFNYETKAEQNLLKAEKDLEKAGFTQSQQNLQTLKTQIQREKEGEFNRHATRLKTLLRAEILSRYFGPELRAKSLLASDSFMAEAVKTLTDTGKYNKILGN